MNKKLNTLFSVLLITLSANSYAAGGWEAYNEKLHKDANCKLSGIFGLKDGLQWAGLAEFKATPDEVMPVIKSFIDPNIIRAKGPTFMGQKYMALEVAQDVITLKKGPLVIYAAHSKSTVVFCFVDTDMNASTRTATMNFASFMTSKGF